MGRPTGNERVKIVTDFWLKPAPDRSCDWAAHTENYDEGSPVEYGETERQAVESLLDNYCMARGCDSPCVLCFAVEGEACEAEVP